MTLRILIADDQALVRTGFRMILNASPDLSVVGEAGDGAEAVRLATELTPDVVLMDVRMPGTDGIEATAAVTALPPPVPRVLVLTTFDADDHVYAALRAGASGFLLKDVTRDELVHAVRVVAAGDALLAPSVTRRLVAEFARQGPSARRPAGPAADRADPLGDLTARERQTLLLLARGRSNAEIATELVVSEHTVKTHVANVLLKLGLRDRIQAVIAAYELGVVRPGAG